LFGVSAATVGLLWLGLLRAEQDELRLPLVEQSTLADGKQRIKWVNVFVAWIGLQMMTFVGLLFLMPLMRGFLERVTNFNAR